MFRGKLQDIIDFYERIIAKMPGHVYWKDRNGNYLGCNDAQAKSLNLTSRDDILYKKPYESLSEHEVLLLKKVDQEVVESGKEVTKEEPGIREDGSTGLFLTKKTPLYDRDDNIVGLLGVSFDITDRELLDEAKREAQEKEKESRAIAALAADMAHNIATPLNIIRAAATMLDKALPTLLLAYQKGKEAGLELSDIDKFILAECEGCTNDIYESAQRVIRFSRETLKNIRAGEVQVAINEKCSIFQELSETLNFYYTTLAEKERELICWQKLEDFDFSGNKESFAQLIENLLNNALEAARSSGKGEINILTKVANDFNYLYIRDTAKGIAEENLPYIFEPFRTFKPHGTGVGLSACRAIMRGFGGGIECNSVLGEYTEFVLKFPVLDD